MNTAKFLVEVQAQVITKVVIVFCLVTPCYIACRPLVAMKRCVLGLQMEDPASRYGE
jgi:hypothetical protein